MIKFCKLILFFGILIFTPTGLLADEAQIQSKLVELEERLKNLEGEMQHWQGTLETVTANIQKSLDDYSDQFQASLQDFNKNLQTNLDKRLAFETHHKVILNPIAKEYTRIDTNSGTFFIMVDKIERSPEGYKLNLTIGNPNVATYKGFVLNLRWGAKWSPENVQPYAEWERDLSEGEFTYNVSLSPGEWTAINADLPAKVEELEYIECALSIKSIELKAKVAEEKAQ